MCQEETSIGIVTTPSTVDSYVEPIRRFVEILSATSDSLYLLGGGEIQSNSPDEVTHFINVGEGEYIGITPIDFISLQIVICANIIRLRSSIDIIYLHKGAMGQALPVIVCRFCRIRICTIKLGAFAGDRTDSSDIDVYTRIMNLLQKIAMYCSHGVVVFSTSEKNTVPNDTVFVAYSNYRDFDFFDIEKGISDRTIEIGFVSRFSRVKGILQLVEATKCLSHQFPNLKVRLVGDGPLYSEVEELIEDQEEIEVTGWVERKNLPQHYNDMLFLFAPSVGEGLPTNVLEAMGCGAIVVTTPVGSLQDLIIDGEIGFYLKSNSPRDIVDTYKDIRTRDDLSTVVENQREFVSSNYSLTASQSKFKKITNEILEHSY